VATGACGLQLVAGDAAPPLHGASKVEDEDGGRYVRSLPEE
jgi:hypothetical protein